MGNFYKKMICYKKVKEV